jgi:hypothetical protein
MDDENERRNPEEEHEEEQERGQPAPTPFKTEIESVVVTDDDGYEWETTKKTRKYIKPDNEIVALKRFELSRFATCGHQITDTRQLARCTYGGHHVCHNCIIQCDTCQELVCIRHSGEYEYHGEILRLCLKCGRKLETIIEEENRLTNRILNLIRNKMGKET